jgi:hypothetical protein
MANRDFTYSFESAKKPEEVFELLLDVPQWWSGFYDEKIDGKSEKVNDEFSFLAGGGMHYTEHKMVELIPNKKVVWLVTNSKLSFLQDPAEWTGTQFGFTLAPDKGKTRVTFTHEGLFPEVACYDQCSNAWIQYMGQLKSKLN